jgi:hypothetical protein
MIIHCLTSPLLDGKAKTLWVILIIFTWPLGAILYGLLACEKKSIPWISAIVIICIGLLSIPIIINMFHSVEQYAVAEFTKLGQLDAEGLSSEEFARFKESVATLQTEVKSSDTKKMVRALIFLQLFRIYTRDNKITLEEYKAWMTKFDSRDVLDLDAFRAYVRGLR